MDNNKPRTYRILIVDDSEVILVALRNFLEDSQLEVYTAHDGLDGMLLLNEIQPDIVFLDIQMPNVDGFTMLQMKKEVKEFGQIPVVIMTAHANKENVINSVQLGAARIITKPLQKKNVYRTMIELLGGDYFTSRQVQLRKNAPPTRAEIKQELLRTFYKQFLVWRDTVGKALHDKNSVALHEVIHEIKGAGGTVEHDEISEMCEEIEMKSIKDTFDWVWIEGKVNTLMDKCARIRPVDNRFRT